MVWFGKVWQVSLRLLAPAAYPLCLVRFLFPRCGGVPSLRRPFFQSRFPSTNCSRLSAPRSLLSTALVPASEASDLGHLLPVFVFAFLIHPQLSSIRRSDSHNILLPRLKPSTIATTQLRNRERRPVRLQNSPFSFSPIVTPASSSTSSFSNASEPSAISRQARETSPRELRSRER